MWQAVVKVNIHVSRTIDMLEFWKLWRAAKRYEYLPVPPHDPMVDKCNVLRKYFSTHGLDMPKLNVICDQIHGYHFAQAKQWLHKIHNAEGRSKLELYLNEYERWAAEKATKPQRPKTPAAKPEPTKSNVRQVGNNSNAPDYEADYKDACKVINELRIEVGSLKQSLNTVKQRLDSSVAYGGRQHERAEKLQSQLKAAGSISDEAYNKLVDDYEALRDTAARQKNELYKLQGRKITFEAGGQGDHG